MSSSSARGFGLPLLKARCHLLADDLTFPALLASDRVASLSIGRPIHIAGNLFPYERLAVPDYLAEGWASWRHQQADPMLKAEVERRSTFLQVSLKLRERLEAGELDGFARQGMLGAWIIIPKMAWRLLTFEFSPSFESWRLGHGSGGGVDLWDIHILDRTGLNMRMAALAYGQDRLASDLQRYYAYQKSMPEALLKQPESESERNCLNQRMQEYGGLSDDVLCNLTSSQMEKASSVLEQDLLQHLRSGEMIGVGRRPDGVIHRLAREDWRRGKPDFQQSSVRTHNLTFEDILIREASSFDAESASQDSAAPRWSDSDVEEWWLDRISKQPDGRWPFASEDDERAGARQFPGLSREAVRSLRQTHLAGRIVMGRRATKEKPREKAAPPLST